MNDKKIGLELAHYQEMVYLDEPFSLSNGIMPSDHEAVVNQLLAIL